MLLRQFVIQLNPYRNGRLLQGKDVWIRSRISVFSFCVRRLQRLYRRYAYYDVINLGSVRIVHSCRDEVFEGWIKTIGRDIRPHMVANGRLPKTSRFQSKWLPFYKFFEFKRQLTVSQAGKKLQIDRTSQLIVSNEMNGTFNISDDTDILLRTNYEITARIHIRDTQKEASEVNNPKKSTIESPTQIRERVSLGKPTISSNSPPIEPKQNESTSKKMRGLEVDESF